ncbi:hypothetical protein JTB14_024984 [Gonioctena quinquepunctata]|nr:hypothetical protein JTB14_024984 [Gonioctena quinquepunctata]
MSIWDFSKGPSWKRSSKSQKSTDKSGDSRPQSDSGNTRTLEMPKPHVCVAFIPGDVSGKITSPESVLNRLSSPNWGLLTQEESGPGHTWTFSMEEAYVKALENLNSSRTSVTGKGGSTADKKNPEGQANSKIKDDCGGGRFASGAWSGKSDSGQGDGGSGLRFGSRKTGPRSGGIESELRKWAECLLVGGETRHPALGERVKREGEDSGSRPRSRDFESHQERRHPDLGPGMGAPASVGELGSLVPGRGMVFPGEKTFNFPRAQGVIHAAPGKQKVWRGEERPPQGRGIEDSALEQAAGIRSPQSARSEENLNTRRESLMTDDHLRQFISGLRNSNWLLKLIQLKEPTNTFSDCVKVTLAMESAYKYSKEIQILQATSLTFCQNQQNMVKLEDQLQTIIENAHVSDVVTKLI